MRKKCKHKWEITKNSKRCINCGYKDKNWGLKFYCKELIKK